MQKVPENRRSPKRVAILGGGISSLTAAFELTSAPNWHHQYDITVYQMGWRLGGKGASSRNPDRANRIEEHGLHIWLGFYENAFQIMRQCYGELQGHDGIFPSWDRSFKPHDLVVLEERMTNGWSPWPVTFPSNASLPGDGTELPTPWDYLVTALEWVDLALEQIPPIDKTSARASVDVSSWSTVAMKGELSSEERRNLHPGRKLVTAARRRAGRVRNRSRRTPGDPALHSLILDLSRVINGRLGGAIADNADLRRIYIPIDFFVTIAKGILADGLLFRGFDWADKFEFCEWMRRHGASQLTLSSAWMRGAYDLAFSYEDGDVMKPNIAAGAGLRAGFRMLLTYKGSILWKMQAGMGETVFTPLYLALQKRGVKFQFFHKVKEVVPAQNGHRIEQIDFTVQATTREPDYQPLVRVGQLLCWQPKPDYAQLMEGKTLLDGHINLESDWADWPGAGTKTLRAQTLTK